MTAKDLLRKFNAVRRSKRGHDALIFCIFLLISALLWCVIAFNDTFQDDIRMPVKITHKPDSVNIVSQTPKYISVSLESRGSEILKLHLSKTPTFNIDFRVYSGNNRLRLSDADLKSIARNALGGAMVSVVDPDSLNLIYTSRAPSLLPVIPDYLITPGPQSSVVGAPELSVDSVKVFSATALPRNLEAITTEPVRLNGITQTTTQRVKLIAPAGSRVDPDSVNITFKVEPLILKTRKVTVEAINVPQNLRLITFPAQVEVIYMMPLSAYKNSEPTIRVTADYRDVAQNQSSRNMKIQIAQASRNIQNVHLATDSVEYIIERL